LGPPDPGAEPEPDEQSLALQKLAFAVAVRINRATPITAISLVTLALLGTANRALSVDETIVRLRNLLDYVRRRNLPTAGDLGLDTREGVQRALDALVENGVVTCFAGGSEAVYLIGPEKHLIASYYRNTIIHFFVNGAIAELALLRAAEDGIADPAAEFWDEAIRLRDLLKVEVFFPESVSQVLFATALSLARNRGLVDPGAPDLVERRRAFAEELREVTRRVDAIDALVAARHAGLID